MEGKLLWTPSLSSTNAMVEQGFSCLCFCWCGSTLLVRGESGCRETVSWCIFMTSLLQSRSPGFPFPSRYEAQLWWVMSLERCWGTAVLETWQLWMGAGDYWTVGLWFRPCTDLYNLCHWCILLLILPSICCASTEYFCILMSQWSVIFEWSKCVKPNVGHLQFM